jgi:hypothetical protein
MEEVKMFLFARWMAVNYGGVLNTERGKWYKQQIKHFNNVVYPNYIKNGTVEKTKIFFNVL